MDVVCIGIRDSRKGDEMTKTINCPSEAQEQAALFQWIEWNTGNHPELKLCMHIPNGGYRNKREAHNLKMQGVKPGVPDIFLPVARKGYHGIFIELKRQKGGKLSESQKEWLDALFNQGYLAVRCDGADEAISTLERYLKI